jgi:phosphoribosyl 1,2-cyclic phosphodiesterase
VVISPSPSSNPVFRVQSLGSGSSGNSFLLEYDDHTLLVDCGVGIRTVQRALRDRGKTLDDLSTILLTHEHSDHVRALPHVLREHMTLMSTAGTARAARLDRDQWVQMIDGRPASVGTMTIWALTVKHDAVEPCGFLVETPVGRATILTDLGSWQPSLLEPLLASDLVVLEANHDEEMLRRGPYPAYLKKRVLSDIGHLSNASHALALAEVAKQHKGEPVVWLAHLSETNNDPELAETTIVEGLHRIDRELPVLALPRRQPGPVWTMSDRKIAAAWHRHKPLVPVESKQLTLGI